jgi:hypothetical protein
VIHKKSKKICLIDVGLDNLNNPHFGGWGGRLVQSPIAPNRWEDGDLAMDFDPYKNVMDKTYPQTRWVDVLQNEFAARADWCVLPYDKANHPPEVNVVQKNNLFVVAGQKVNLKAVVSDPDGDKVTYKWWQYHEVDTYPSKVDLGIDTGSSISFTIPVDARSGNDIHLILNVTDAGTPALTRYKRIVLHIK